MADSTAFLNLVLPGNGEFVDSWEIPVNNNMTAIDTWANSTNTEIVNARFTKSSLQEFLAVSHNNDGTLIASQEVVAARGSSVYGEEDAGANDFDLNDRLEKGDLDVWKAWEGSDSLRAALAARAVLGPSLISDGSKDSNGFPTWLGFTADKARVDGATQQIDLLIDGFRSRIRVLEEITISGVAGTYFLYADFQATGVERVDGDSTTPPPATPVGTTSNDGSGKPRIFSDNSKDFTALDVQPGDQLTLIDGNDAGSYIIEEIAPDSNTDQVKIVGIFPNGGLSSINYTIRDPMAVALGFAATETAAAGRLFIGEADWDGAAVTAVRPRHFLDSYVGDWRAIDVSGSPDFTEEWNHYLGSTAISISIQVSQANDNSAAIEEMSVSELDNTLALSVGNGTLAYNQGTFNPGSSDASYTDGTLSGDVTGSLSGDVLPQRSVKYKWTRNTITVKNAVSGKFYKDFDNNVRQTGFIRVVVRRRG